MVDRPFLPPPRKGFSPPPPSLLQRAYRGKERFFLLPSYWRVRSYRCDFFSPLPPFPFLFFRGGGETSSLLMRDGIEDRWRASLLPLSPPPFPPSSSTSREPDQQAPSLSTSSRRTITFPFPPSPPQLERLRKHY